MAANIRIGFTGTYRDLVTFAYPLGDGYRWYLSGRMGFNVADALSPFGGGGLGPYAYCAGDPINRIDPSGHVSFMPVLNWARTTYSRLRPYRDDDPLTVVYANPDSEASPGAAGRGIGESASPPRSIMRQRRSGSFFRRVGSTLRFSRRVRFKQSKLVKFIDDDWIARGNVSGAEALVGLKVDEQSQATLAVQFLQYADGALAQAVGEVNKIANLTMADAPALIDPYTGLDRKQYVMDETAREDYQQGLIAEYKVNAVRFLNTARTYYGKAVDAVTDADSVADSMFDPIASRHERIGQRLLEL